MNTADNGNGNKPTGGERFTGHGAEWRDAQLSPDDARTATAWVEQVIDKRSMEINKDRVEDVRELEHGELDARICATSCGSSKRKVKLSFTG